MGFKWSAVQIRAPRLFLTSAHLTSLGGYPCVLRFVFLRFFGLPRFTILVTFGSENLLLICPARGWLLRCPGGAFLCLPGVGGFSWAAVGW